MARLCVIDDSAAIRETVEIVLGGGHDVLAVSPDEFAADPAVGGHSDLFVVGDDLPAHALAAIPPAARVLWLRAVGGRAPAGRALSAALPRWFTPADLRRQVALLLARAASATPPLALPEYPLVSTPVAALIARAARTQLPALLCGEPGTGKLHVARALHAFANDGNFVALPGGECIQTTLERLPPAGSAPVTLYIPELLDLDRRGQHILREVLLLGGLNATDGVRPARLLVGSAAPIEALAQNPGVDPSLLYQLGTFPIELTPLRHRSDEIPDLITHLAPQLARDLHKTPVSFTGAAVQRLQRYLWFGNLAEFRSVLLRTIALADGDTVDAADLRFGVASGSPAPRVAVSATPDSAPVDPPRAGISETGSAFGMVVNELAHEFKNPMVTIKTVAQHLEKILEDKSGRTQLARLTGDAVDRMDRAIENLLQFTRFGEPRPEAVPLRALLSPALIDLRSLLIERQVKVDYQPTNNDHVNVDAAQVAYALDNVLRTVVRELGEEEALHIRRPAGREIGVEISFNGAFPSFAEKLEKMLGTDPAGTDNSLGAPLGLFLARVLIERNHGALQVVTSGGKTTVTVTLPAAPARVLHHAEPARPRR